MTVHGQPHNVIQLSEEELRGLVTVSVRQTLIQMGIDADDPLKMQKDFQHLREWRETTDLVKSRTIYAVVGVIAAGTLGALWVGIKSILHIG